jgi:hypothetical protein
MKYVNKQDSKDQVERFGMIVRDEEFFKKSEEILKEYIITKPKKAKKVSDEEKVEDITDEVTEE